MPLDAFPHNHRQHSAVREEWLLSHDYHQFRTHQCWPFWGTNHKPSFPMSNILPIELQGLGSCSTSVY